jgi:hypothetical protein
MQQKTTSSKQLQSYRNANNITKKNDGQKTPYVRIPQIIRPFHFALERKRMTIYHPTLSEIGNLGYGNMGVCRFGVWGVHICTFLDI